jgi:hypothetical protein
MRSKIFTYYWAASFIFFLLACRTTKTNVSTVDPSKYTVVTKTKIVEVDNLGHLYVVDDRNTISHYSPDMAPRHEYKDRRFGEVTTLDVTNPLKIVAFSNDLNRVKVLDNTLSEIESIDLSQKFVDITACGSSNDGNLWVYDAIQFKLVKVDKSGNKILESSNVHDFGMQATHITDIKERGNHVILCDRDKGFFVFDNFGQFRHSYPVNDRVRYFQHDGQEIMYYTTTGLKSYNLSLKERRMVGIPIEGDLTDRKYVISHGGSFYDIRPDGIIYIKGTAKTN